jgi:thymidylate kinase
MTDKQDQAEVVSTPHRYVVVEGPIGVGKTSLARRLAQSFGSELVLEQDQENPFLERFYRNPRAAAFQTQLYFLFQRARQLQDLRQHDLFEQVRVADYLLDKDRLFARLTLDDEEYALYEQVYARLAIDAPVPDLVVYLQAPVDVLLERISGAGSGTSRNGAALPRAARRVLRVSSWNSKRRRADCQRGRDRSRRQRRGLWRVARRNRPLPQGPALLQSPQKSAVVPGVDV